jgi:hypothetical protein
MLPFLFLYVFLFIYYSLCKGWHSCFMCIFIYFFIIHFLNVAISVFMYFYLFIIHFVNVGTPVIICIFIHLFIIHFVNVAISVLYVFLFIYYSLFTC